jgi:hypothetical protein
VDRDRLRDLLRQATDQLSSLAETAIESRAQAALPPALRMMLPSMADLLQIRSTISGVSTAVDELTDDECRSLIRWLVAELQATTLDELPPEMQSVSAWHEVAKMDRAAASPAIAHLRRVLAPAD